MNMLAVLLPALLIGSVFSAFAGGGLGIIMLLIGSAFFPVQENIAIIGTLLLGIQASKLLHFYADARWSVVGWYLVLGVPTSFLGGLVLFLLPAELIGRILGAALLLVALKDLLPKYRLKLRPTPRMLVLSGAVNGLLGGMLGNAAVMRGQVLLAIGLSKAEFIGTSTAIALPMSIAKSAVYVTRIPWSAELVVLFVCGMPLMLAGVWLGKKLLTYVHTEVFLWLQRGIIILGAIRFLLF